MRPRSDDYPNKLIKTGSARRSSWTPRNPLVTQPRCRRSTSSAAYVNPEGITLGPCEYCGHCNRTSCESNSKASPNVNDVGVRFELKFEAR